MLFRFVQALAILAALSATSAVSCPDGATCQQPKVAGGRLLLQRNYGAKAVSFGPDSETTGFGNGDAASVMFDAQTHGTDVIGGGDSGRVDDASEHLEIGQNIEQDDNAIPKYDRDSGDAIPPLGLLETNDSNAYRRAERFAADEGSDDNLTKDQSQEDVDISDATTGSAAAGQLMINAAGSVPGYILFGTGNCVKEGQDEKPLHEIPDAKSSTACKKFCDDRADCFAYQYSNRLSECRIFMEDVDDADSREWIAASCYYKDNGYDYMGTRMCVGKGAPPYPQINAGSLSSAACVRKCNEDGKCHGFSVSRGKCYLWLSPIMHAGGTDWNGYADGYRYCYKKKEHDTYEPPAECSTSKPKPRALSAPEWSSEEDCYNFLHYLQKDGPDTPCRIETYQVEVRGKPKDGGKSWRLKTREEDETALISFKKKKHDKSKVRARVRYLTLDGKVWSKWSKWSGNARVSCWN